MEFNEQQKEVINSEADKIVCIAAAGSGKTVVLLNRIRKLIENGADPQSMLVLTFTNAAAHEMVERFEKFELGDTVPTFGTFHAFCYSLIVECEAVRAALGYADIPVVAADDDIRTIRTSTRLVCGTKLSDKKLEGPREVLTYKEQFEYDVYWKQYRKSLLTEGLITFDIMCYDVCKLFTEHRPCIQQYLDRYKYVFCDEFQDTDTLQMEFIESFDGAKLFVCGDPQQMLYRFRGCTNDIIKQLASSSEWTLIKLPRNYRSTKQIVDFSNRIFAEAWAGSPYYLQGISDSEGAFVKIAGKFPMSAWSAASILKDIAMECKDKSVAILCRTNLEVSTISNMLKHLNIPYKGKTSNAETAGILRSSLSCENCVAWLSSLLPNKEFAEYIRMLTTEPDISQEPKFLSVFGDRFESQLNKIFDCRRALGNQNIPAGLMEVAKILDINVRAEQVSAFDNIRDGVAFLIDQTGKTAEKGIYVGTIHSVKGLEYDTVHVLGVNGKYFPVFKDEDQMACFYVACTRAKTRLTIWCDRTKTEYLQPDGIFD